MTRKERTYSALVILMALFVFVSCAQFQLLLAPRAKDPNFMRFIAFVLGLEGLTLLITAGINLTRDRLCHVSTMVQSILLLLMFPMGTVLGVWGLRLLRKRRTDAANNGVHDSLASSAS